MSSQAGEGSINDRDIEPIVGLFPRHYIQGQRQTQGIERGHHGLDLPQGRIILALSELPQALLTPFTIA